MAKRPGIMFYFDILSQFEELSVDEIGEIFLAMLKYGDTGELPEFQDRALRIVWADMQKYVDRDKIAYDKYIEQKQHAVYSREEKKKGLIPLKIDEWRANRPISTDIDRCDSITDDIQLSTINVQRSTINGQRSTVNEPPTLEQIRDYVAREHIQVDSQRFFDYYSRRNWRDKSGHIISDWKATIRGWEKNTIQDQPQRPFIPTDFDKPDQE